MCVDTEGVLQLKMVELGLLPHIHALFPLLSEHFTSQTLLDCHQTLVSLLAALCEHPYLPSFIFNQPQLVQLVVQLPSANLNCTGSFLTQAIATFLQHLYAAIETDDQAALLQDTYFTLLECIS